MKFNVKFNFKLNGLIGRSTYFNLLPMKDKGLCSAGVYSQLLACDDQLFTENWST